MSSSKLSLADSAAKQHPLTGATMNGADMIVQVLADEGVDTIFGYSGGAILPTYDAVFRYNESHPEKNLRLIVPATEQGAGFMASGYAPPRPASGARRPRAGRPPPAAPLPAAARSPPRPAPGRARGGSPQPGARRAAGRAPAGGAARQRPHRHSTSLRTAPCSARTG